jgi:hypothetical protein
VSATPVEEDGDPAADAVLSEAHREALVRHAGDDQAETGPGVEPLMDQVQLARTVAHQHGGERGAEAAGVERASSSSSTGIVDAPCHAPESRTIKTIRSSTHSAAALAMLAGGRRRSADEVYCRRTEHAGFCHRRLQIVARCPSSRLGYVGDIKEDDKIIRVFHLSVDPAVRDSGSGPTGLVSIVGRAP